MLFIYLINKHVLDKYLVSTYYALGHLHVVCRDA